MLKAFTTLALLASLALATPPPACKPATYACAKNPDTYVPGWQVCDVTGKWVVSILHDPKPIFSTESCLLTYVIQYAGDCPPYTKCYFLEANGSPYCIP